MSSQDTRTLIGQALHGFADEVPALRNLKLVMRLELRSRGDIPVWRVELPGPTITKDAAGDARIHVEIGRAEFNKLAAEGTLKEWMTAYDKGHIRVSGDEGVLKLVGNVVQRQAARGQALR